MAERNWAPCRNCPHGPEEHEAVIIRPVCVDPGDRVLFEGTLGTCRTPGCKCSMYSHHPVPKEASRG